MVEKIDTYRELFEHSQDAILIIEEDRFVECNPAAVRMLRFPDKQALLERYSGGDREGSLRAHPAELSPQTQSDGRDSFEKAEEMMALAIRHGSHRFEWDHLRADGEVFPVEVLLTAVDRGPKPVFHVVWREIAERKKLEQELRQSQRLESVGRLAGGIAHDFNNLLVVIRSNAETLRSRLDDALMTEEAAAAAEILDASDRASNLTRQLLTFSRGKPTRPEPIDLAEVLRGLTSLLERLIGEDVEFETRLPDEPIVVVADQTQMEQLIVNLVANSRDAMPTGGRLEIELSRERPSSSEESSDQATTGYAMMRVSDTGEGIDPEKLDRVFDPFYTTKPPGSGSGLGLATVHSIVEQCGGHAHIESALGKGTSVTVRLPLSSETRAPSSDPPAEPASLEGAESILVVEDELAIRRLLRKILEARGYRVVEASNGSEALDLVRRGDHAFDLVVTDVVMPRLSGPELVGELRNDRPDLKVVFMTGYAQDELREQTVAVRGAEILEKPFPNDALLVAVRRLLDR